MLLANRLSALTCCATKSFDIFLTGGTQPPVTNAPNTKPPITNAPVTNNPQTNAPVTIPPTGNCKDVYKECYQWKKWCNDGDPHHLDYMKKVCPKTCKFCGGGALICV